MQLSKSWNFWILVTEINLLLRVCQGLATKFATFTSNEMDGLEMEFCDFRASDADLPWYDPHVSSAVDKFWSTMAEVRSVTDSETFHYSVLPKLAKIFHIQMQIQRGSSVWLAI